jgi:hypothetical protein
VEESAFAFWLSSPEGICFCFLVVVPGGDLLLLSCLSFRTLSEVEWGRNLLLHPPHPYIIPIFPPHTVIPTEVEASAFRMDQQSSPHRNNVLMEQSLHTQSNH